MCSMKRKEMKLAHRFLLFVICIVSFNFFSFGQEVKPTPSLSLPEPDFTITVKHDYRKGEVISLVSLERMFIKSPDSQSEPIGFGSLFGYDEKSKFVPSAYIAFYSYAEKCRFPTDPDTTFIVDGDPIRVSSNPEAISRGEGNAFSFSELEGGKCNDSLSIILPQKVYLKIANAKRSIEVRVDKLKFQLGELHLKALNELARRMVQ